VVDAATEAGIGLDVVGSGPSMAGLRSRAGPSVTFHGQVEEDVLRELLLGCRALCFPGSEDFGIVPVEANAAGKPVVAFAEGGVLETQVEGKTASFFRQPTKEDALDAIRQADELQTSPEAIAKNADRFSPDVFRIGLLAAIEEARQAKADGGKSYAASRAATA
jgi:glycosyltransferase involved in cell wall biosynthesis